MGTTRSTLTGHDHLSPPHWRQTDAAGRRLIHQRKPAWKLTRRQPLYLTRRGGDVRPQRVGRPPTVW